MISTAMRLLTAAGVLGPVLWAGTVVYAMMNALTLPAAALAWSLHLRKTGRYSGFALYSAASAVLALVFRDFGVDDSSMRACIAKWQMRGVRDNGAVTAEFSWQHAQGWQSMRVMSSEMDLRVSATGASRGY